MKKHLALASACALLTACGSNQPKQQEAPQVQRPAYNMPAGNVQVAMTARMAQTGAVPMNVQNECTDLGSNFSASIKKYSDSYGKTVDLVAGLNPVSSSGIVLDTEIVSVYSAGNAFMGHRKSATIKADLYIDGKMVDSFSATRDSGGGFMGGFKGSCAVLYHTVNTLGNDVAKWLKSK